MSPLIHFTLQKYGGKYHIYKSLLNSWSFTKTNSCQIGMNFGSKNLGQEIHYLLCDGPNNVFYVISADKNVLYSDVLDKFINSVR